MSRYNMLVRVLDGIRDEAAGTKHAKQYAVGSSDLVDIWQARARAYIHLYLKVMFGIDDFASREAFVTDGGRDGGIDGYYIDANARVIYILQSKFRHSEENFESKPMDLEDLLAMQIRRVLSGDENDEQGHFFNGKIKGLQRRLSEIVDIGRYTYKVVIIANLKKVSDDALRRLTDNFEPTVIDYEKAYVLLLYPVLSGTLFKATGLGISIDLSNKSTGAKIGYSVSAEDVDCDITVVFVPTIEIARVMSTYKNSILTYNPRSYLEFLGDKVNSAIRDSILHTKGNDFALLNNGITIICDESGVNEQSGRKNKAQLFLLNPQIINGGQTAYTLSRIYEDAQPSAREKLFEGKEVMVKAIAVEVSGDKAAESKRVALIEKISTATNNQTPVTLADRTSSDPLNISLQQVLFEKYGILYERKRGEFSEGLRQKYIAQTDIAARVHFTRLYLTANGLMSKALKRRLTIQDLPDDVATNIPKLDAFIIASASFDALQSRRSTYGREAYVSVLPRVKAAVVVARRMSGELSERGRTATQLVNAEWRKFLDYSVAQNYKFVRVVVDRQTGDERTELRGSREILGAPFENAVETYFGAVECQQ